jgi:hypothetical protein
MGGFDWWDGGGLCGLQCSCSRWREVPVRLMNNREPRSASERAHKDRGFGSRDPKVEEILERMALGTVGLVHQVLGAADC